MGWKLMARKNFFDTIRERQFHVFVGFSVLLGLGVGYVYADNFSSTPGPQLTGVVAILTAYIATIVGLSVSQNDVVDKRIKGELKVLLGLPFTRAELIAGTFAGRLAMVSVCVAAIYFVTGLVALVMGGSVDLFPYALTFSPVLVLSAAFVAIGVSMSAATSNSTVASAGAFGAVILFIFKLWNSIPSLLLMALNGFEPVEEVPFAGKLFAQLNPFSALGNLLIGAFPELADTAVQVLESPPENPEIYRTPEFAAVVLLAWIAVPLVLSYQRFRKADL